MVALLARAVGCTLVVTNRKEYTSSRQELARRHSDTLALAPAPDAAASKVE